MSSGAGLQGHLTDFFRCQDDTWSSCFLVCSFRSTCWAQDILCEALGCFFCLLQPRLLSSSPLLGPTLQSRGMCIQGPNPHPCHRASLAGLWLLEVGLQGGVTQAPRLYQGSLQEEYGCNALIFIGGQPAVPAAAAEPALGLRVQVELGAEGAILPALPLCQAGLGLQGESSHPAAPMAGPCPQSWPAPGTAPHQLQEGQGLLLGSQPPAIPAAHTHPAPATTGVVGFLHRVPDLG